MKSLLIAVVFLISTLYSFSQVKTLTSDSLSNFNKDSSVVLSSERKDWVKVKELIASGISCNTIYKSYSPLIWASYYNDIEMVKYLLLKGADPNLGEYKSPFSVSDNDNYYTDKKNFHPEVVKILTQNALSKTFIINGVKKSLLVKPTSEEIRNIIKNLMKTEFGDAGVGIEFEKIAVEDPVKQKIRVYGEAATWTQGMVYKLSYLDYYVLTRKADGKWEAEMIKKPEDWFKNSK